jgi:ribosomal protein L18
VAISFGQPSVPNGLLATYKIGVNPSTVVAASKTPPHLCIIKTNKRHAVQAVKTKQKRLKAFLQTKTNDTTYSQWLGSDTKTKTVF